MKKIYILMLYVVFLVITIYAYRGLSSTTLQQDEWATLGQVLSSGPMYFLQLYSVGELLSGIGRPLGTIINNFLYTLFPLNVLPIIAYGMLVHAANGVLIFLLTNRLTKKTSVSMLAALFFVTSFSMSQSLTWFAATVNTLGAVFFLLVSLIVFLDYLESVKIKYLWFSYIYFYISVLFKESALIGILVFPLVYVLFRKKQRYISYQIMLLPLICFIIFLLAIRVPSLLEQKVVGFTTYSENASAKIVLHTALYPFTSFSQQFIPRQFMFRLSSDYQMVNYAFLSKTTMQSSILENATTDFVSLIITFLLFVVSFVIFVKEKTIRKPFVFGIIFSFIGFLPYVVFNRGTSYLDSRYYYMSMVGGSIVLSMVVYGLYKLRTSLLPVIMCMVLLYIYKNIIFIQRDIQSLQFDSSVRTKLLDEIYSLVPNPGLKPVFYITGNRSYFGVDTLHVPLQAGPGYILKVKYFLYGYVPVEMVRDAFLFDVREQGYRTFAENSAFGYYSDYHMLQTDYARGLFKAEQIYALYYDGNAYSVTDISGEIRKQIQYE